MEPISMSEHLMFNTVKITARDGSTGTGFFFYFNVPSGEGTYVPVIITNKHVVNYNENEIVEFYFHVNNNGDFYNENIKIISSFRWIFHPTKDLCFCFVQPIINEIKLEKGKSIHYTPVYENIIPSQKQLEDLSALEEITMIGYPNGLWDSINNFPVFRKGYTATHPAIDFNEKNEGLVDVAAFPGSSGSPIFVLNEGTYSTKDGKAYVGTRIHFLGVLYAGPVIDVEGEVVEKEITLKKDVISQMSIMMNLGYYIKSSEIFELKKICVEIMKNVKNHSTV